ncbi:hypothetical protein SAMN04515647_2701 [Cohaesibacter sp. ES.047]|uniref:hypothetical protein n=1 Tax=Cohaesibacter sp. ES.047 TaxID=1798205 RepID=UPI000BB6AE20|nr:hypothetical protein [Cohaesibacter sp. ES.047]SNY92428.1 hypothetical protein SAMN04515647_2701 [Cohaesibacter sp. ES.047]
MKEDKTEGRILPSRHSETRRSALGKSALSMACLLAPLGLAACSGIGGTTYGTGVTQEQALIDDISSLAGGGASKDQPRIEYTPRASLVLPPDTSRLPPPDQKNPLVAKNADWPTDPDELRKLYAERMENMTDKERQQLLAAIRRLPPEQRNAIIKNNSNSANFARQIKEPDLKASAQAKADYEKQVQERLALIRLQQGKNSKGRKYLTQPPERFTDVSPEVQQELATLNPEKENESVFQKIWPF